MLEDRGWDEPYRDDPTGYTQTWDWPSSCPESDYEHHRDPHTGETVETGVIWRETSIEVTEHGYEVTYAHKEEDFDGAGDECYYNGHDLVFSTRAELLESIDAIEAERRGFA